MSEEHVSWRAAPANGQVMDTEDHAIGLVESVLGDADDDIFHGLAVKLAGNGRVVEVPADRITRITTERIYTDLSSDQLENLGSYEDSKWYRVEWSGRHHDDPKWRPSGEA